MADILLAGVVVNLRGRVPDAPKDAAILEDVHERGAAGRRLERPSKRERPIAIASTLHSLRVADLLRVGRVLDERA